MHPSRQLDQLQTLDLERDAHRRRLKQVLAALAEPEALRAAELAVTAAHAQAAHVRARRQDLELETQTLEDKVTSVEERLYSGQVKNPKELADLQNDAASLRRRRVALDDVLLEAMVALEEAERAERQKEDEREALVRRWQADQRTLTDERRQLEAAIAALTEQRDQKTATISPGHLEPYQKLRREYAGLAVARVEDDGCGACGVQISDRQLARARLSEELSFCSNCERILVIE
jgi:predicted  nucleic acid-binding Zn-ribbon protein